MAVRVVCAVRDNAVEAFGQPFFVAHVGAASRAFVDDVRTPDSPAAKHPADYDLYEIGSFDDETAVLVSITPKLLLRGVAAVEGGV